MSGDSQTLDQTLNKTDLGKLISDHKNTIIAVFVVLIGLAIGTNFYLSNQKEETNKDLGSLYQFRSTKFKEFKEGKLNFEAFKKEVKSLRADLITSPLALPLVSDMALDLTKKNHNDLALELLENLRAKLNPSDISFAIISFRVANHLENKKEFSKAVAILEKTLKSGHKVLEDKIYFDLGRNKLYLKQNAEAKKDFEFVVKNHPNSDLAKMAQLYLEKL